LRRGIQDVHRTPIHRVDFGQAAGLMIMGVMGHIPDDDEAQSIVQRMLAGLPSRTRPIPPPRGQRQ
jgi:hypothetical protein